MSKWLLVGTFGVKAPCVVGVGSTPKAMVPLSAVLTRNRVRDVERAVAYALSTSDTYHARLDGGRRQILAQPLPAFDGRVHAVYVWSGSADDQPPPRDPAGSWFFNLTTNKIGGSDGLLDLYGVPPEKRREERMLAEAFSRLVMNDDVGAAFAKIVNSRVGDEHQAVWTVRRDDGQLRATHFSCRAVAEPSPTDPHQIEVILRGVSHDIGDAAHRPSAPPAVVLAQQVLAGPAEIGTHRAIVNLRNLALLRWEGEPMPGIAWELETLQGQPWIHPDDTEAAVQIGRGLATGKTNGTLRFRTTDDQWRTLNVAAELVLLDSHTTAALLTLAGA